MGERDLQVPGVFLVLAGGELLLSKHGELLSAG